MVSEDGRWIIHSMLNTEGRGMLGDGEAGHAEWWIGRTCWEMECQGILSDGQKVMLENGEVGHAE